MSCFCSRLAAYCGVNVELRLFKATAVEDLERSLAEHKMFRCCTCLTCKKKKRARQKLHNSKIVNF